MRIAKYITVAALAVATAFTGHAQKLEQTPAETDSLSRAAATILADNLVRSLAGLEGMGLTVDDVKFNETLITALSGGQTGFNLQSADQYISGMLERAQQVYAKQQGEFVDSIAKTDGAVMMPSGVVLVVLTEGEGVKPTAADKVRINYAGKLSDGTVFDETKGEPIVFDVANLVPGFTEGLEQMKPGGKYRLVIPADKAYGSRGVQGVIPPNSALDFTIDLLEVIPAAKADAPVIEATDAPATK